MTLRNTLRRLEYLLFNLLVIAAPFLLSIPTTTEIIPETLPALLALLPAVSLFTVWDHLVTGWFWVFNPRHLIGLRIGRLPIEEILFFLTVPYASLYLWTNLEVITPHLPSLPRSFPLLLMLLSAAGGVSALLVPSSPPTTPPTAFVVAPRFRKEWSTAVKSLPQEPGTAARTMARLLPPESRPYTAATLLVWSLTCLLDETIGFRLLRDPRYWLFLIPLGGLTFLFNGYLTARPVVIYNERTKTPWRIRTVPWEDFVYGFSLVTMVLSVYHRLTTPY